MSCTDCKPVVYLLKYQHQSSADRWLFATFHPHLGACLLTCRKTLTNTQNAWKAWLTARREYSGPSVHMWPEPSRPLLDLGPPIFCLLPLNVLSMLPSVSPPQCKVGALFKPLLPLTHMQGSPSLLQHQPKSSSPQPVAKCNSINNGGML